MKLPSISEIFRSTQQVTPATLPVAPPAPATPGSTMQLQDSGAGNPNPAVSNVNVNASPLDSFNKMWDTDPAATPPVDPWSAPILPSDPAKIQQAASQMNMLQGVDPALVQKVQAGGDPVALMDLINRVAQNTLSMGAQLATAANERAGVTIRDRLRTEIPTTVRDIQLDNIPIENPVLNHPGAQGLLKMVRAQVRQQNPAMSAEQINAKAVDYLSQFGGAMAATSASSGAQPAQLDNSGSPVMDWDSFTS